ncbi:hypothetical protein [Allosaccharopolyspora coralli]|nr:hypothetical protein [Allosaccharopolyspora coralli]
MSLFKKASEFAKGPQGKKMMDQAKKFASDPKTKSKLNEFKKKFNGDK